MSTPTVSAPKPSSLHADVPPELLVDATLQGVLAAVAQTPERLAAILDGHREPLLAFTALRSILYANEAAERFFGYARHALEGRSTDMIVPERFRVPDAPPQLVTTELTTVELPGLRGDGSEISTVWTYAAARRPGGPIFVLMARGRAVMLEQLELLRRSDARYRSLLLASATIVWVTNAAGELVELQPSWQEYTGQTWEEYQGSKWISAVHPDDRPRLMSDWTNALAPTSEQYRSYGRIWSAKHNTWRAFQVRAVSVRDVHGEIVEWVGALTDVQDTLDAQERLRESEARYAVLFEASPFPLALTRMSDGIMVAINQAFAELFEVSARDVTGKSTMELGFSTPAERAEVIALLERDGVLRSYECARRTASGKPLHVSVYMNRVRLGGVEHVLTTVQDISERKRQEAALAQAMEHERQARAEAESANRAKDEFLATMSHELRTPLNSMLGWATLLRDKPRDEAKLDRGLEIIERNAKAQERIVSDLLDMSRIISGKLSLSLQRVSLWDVLHAAAEVVRPAAEAKGVRLLVDVDPDLPAIVADGSRLQQVFWNILTNAIRHTARAGRVTVTTGQADRGVQVRVKDTGEGIGEQHLARIFERFRQVDSSTTRAHGGLGLGLAIVRHLVEAHGGGVQAHSAGPGQGATFVVTLPVSAVDTSPAPQAPAGANDIERSWSTVAAAAGARCNLKNVRVLVVEDDPDSLDLLRTVLEAAGAKVTAVEQAPDALEEPGPFDVIVSDIGLPQMDGYTMMEQMRARATSAQVPAIALTAYVGRERAERARRAGFQEHLPKPVDATRLLETVQRWSREKLSS